MGDNVDSIFQEGIRLMRMRRQIQRGGQDGTQMMTGEMGMMGDKGKPMGKLASKIKKMKSKKKRKYSQEAVKLASEKSKT